MLEPVRRHMTRYRKRSEQTTAPALRGGDWCMGGWVAGMSTLKGRKGRKKPLSLSPGLLLAAAMRKYNSLTVFWHENIGKLDISKSKGIERHSFNPCISEGYDSKFLPFYSFIAMGDIQRFHRRWVKAIQPVCLPLIFPLIYSSAPIIPPLRAAVTPPLP